MLSYSKRGTNMIDLKKMVKQYDKMLKNMRIKLINIRRCSYSINEIIRSGDV